MRSAFLDAFFPFGRRRPSVSVTLGGITRTLMNIEQSVSRIEQQNGKIVEVLATVLAGQKALSDTVKSLAGAVPSGADQATLEALDVAIGETDAKLAALAGSTGTAAAETPPAAA